MDKLFLWPCSISPDGSWYQDATIQYYSNFPPQKKQTKNIKPLTHPPLCPATSLSPGGIVTIEVKFVERISTTLRGNPQNTPLDLGGIRTNTPGSASDFNDQSHKSHHFYTHSAFFSPTYVESKQYVLNI